MPRTIDSLALRQLAAWENIARKAPVYTSQRGFVRCAWCDLTVWRKEDDKGQPYQITDADILALRVAHLRNHHPNLDPCEDIT
jgi:hypothetical protein